MDMDIDDCYTEAYDVTANEPRPDSVVYTEIFRDLQSLHTQAIALLRGPLEKSKFRNYITDGLLQDIENRTKHAQSEEVTFAVAGDMKAGKSSVINSILSIGTIARKGDGGDSCTWVVQRYRKMFDSQKSPFAAKVFFFNRSQIRGIMGALLTKYYRAANKEKEEDDDDQQGSNVESFGEMRDTIAAFMALFCDKEEFETESAAHKYLQQAKSENDQAILEELVDLAGEVVQNFMDGNEFVLIEKSTPEELLWALQPYTYQIGGIDGEGEVSPWPLVSVIDFGLDHPLLNEGVVFVDSPGLSDANAVRSRNAIKHHRKCTHKIVVAEIGRAEADANVRKNLEIGYRTRGSGSTILVLTHGDSIDPETEVIGHPTENKRVARLGAELKNLRAERTKKQQQRSKLRSSDDRDDIEEEIRSIGAEMRHKQIERDGVRLEMRNRKVVVKMQDIYRKLTQDPKNLSVIAVGNKVYTQYQAGFSNDEKPDLSVKQTNIPALRHRLYTMPVEGRYNDTMHFAEVQLPNLINSIELYCSQLHMARKGEIEAIVLAPKKKVREIVHSALEGYKEQATEMVLQPMKLRESEWIKPARKACAEWKTKYRGKLALLRKEGHEKGRRGAKDVNWNAELANIGVDCLDVLFRDFQATSASWTHPLFASLAKLCNTTRDTLKRDRQFYTMALDPLLRNFNLKNKAFDKVLASGARQLGRDISDLHEKATSPYSGSYIEKAMKPIYEEAAKIKNRGAPAKRAEFVEQRVTKRDGVWLSVHDSIDAALDKLLKRYEDAITKKIEGLFDDLHKDFLLLCADTEPKEEKDKVQEDIMRAELKENLAAVKTMIESGGAIPDLVAKCKQYSVSSNSSQLFVQ